MSGEERTPPLAVRRVSPPHEDDDEGLLARVAEGDRTALVALYRRHGGAVLAQISLVVGDRGLGEEVLQDTMLAVWKGAASFEGRSRVRSWIISIARRQARDRLRRRRPRIVAADALEERPATGPGPEDVALERAEATAVAHAITRLGAAHREVLETVFGAGLTLAEAADVLEVPLGTVKSRLSAARGALARELSEKGYAR
ncbi:MULTISPECIES: RNA polymerase sigma factor [Actinomadura]|uniref:RNA polymerase sigma factor n=1 Tax=Actinomadura yumaensis TaxID=111807 RepID=A0ABW2CAQ1_9ACTN|nr:sigma-70 family RNA polymerase sigma factor [Actinomadura sp. J1-007]MWK34014.1 sigma-70 family RNA polymerase sigma factor [Actinomadura sp. J1-007]